MTIAELKTIKIVLNKTILIDWWESSIDVEQLVYNYLFAVTLLDLNGSETLEELLKLIDDSEKHIFLTYFKDVLIEEIYHNIYEFIKITEWI